MTSDSTDEGEVPHYACLVLRIVSPFPTEITILCHHAEANDIFLLGGRVGPSLFSKLDKVDIFLLETLILQIGFRLLSYPLLHIIISKLNILYSLQM